MTCENHFCIYWSDDSCLLQDIHLDILGCCRACIYIDVPEETLEQARRNLREIYDVRS